MRPTAKFSISFGLVTIPVAAYNATDTSASVSFVRIHTADGGRVRNQPVCSLEGTEVSPDEIGRGYRPQDADVVVPLSDEDLEALPLPTARTLTILAFVAGGDIDPLQMGKGYYLATDNPAAAKPYVLLREAMERHERVGLGKIALHGRETLAMIRPMGDALVMQVLLWPHQIRSMDGVLPEREVEVHPNEVAAAETLMDSFGELSEDDLHDHYREALDELVAAKLAHREPEFGTGEEQPAGGQVMDLMAALQDSVRAAKRSRGEDEGDEGRTAAKRPAKKAAAKTSTASGTKTGTGSGAKSGTKTASGGAAKKSAKSAAAKSTAKKTAGKSAAKKTASRGTRRAG
ncbi:Ku protein [Streptomyces lydicus]|uniref:non-homologous end joining protein Ku n=1 Tax=Streptomyces lydicus TaxID=47763 RepID=UPI0037B2EF17